MGRFCFWRLRLATLPWASTQSRYASCGRTTPRYFYAKLHRLYAGNARCFYLHGLHQGCTDCTRVLEAQGVRTRQNGAQHTGVHTAQMRGARAPVEMRAQPRQREGS
eukprot:scaffold272041_cov21-Tisochrysis_lutea.AAC.1